jgi:putative tricarboxylic transport membrane protein
MIFTALHDLWFGFEVALRPENLMWCLIGAAIGNFVGVLPGLGVVSTVSLLLPLTFAMNPIPALLMIAGVFYGAQYGGVVASILLNLPIHPPHAVSVLDGYPMTQQGRGGKALSIAMISGFVGASWGITMMVFLSPLLVKAALQFSSADVCTLMLVGLLAGSTLARGSPLKGVAMVVFGLLLALVGTDLEYGTLRFTFGSMHLVDGVDIVALALGVFGIAEFMKSVNNIVPISTKYQKISMRDMYVSSAELKRIRGPIFRGIIMGTICSIIPGVGPVIGSFGGYALERKFGKRRHLLGTGIEEGVAAPEAATHSAIQGDFIPTMSLGIPGDAVMALMLSAIIIQDIVPGPLLITDHPDVFWGLVASFWIGNIAIVLMNFPLIGLWVKLLTVPYRILFPTAMFFICIGVYSASNDMFQVWVTVAFGVFGYVMWLLGFEPAPLLLGYVLGLRFEENFRRAMLTGGGDIRTFIYEPISAVFVLLSVVMIAYSTYSTIRASQERRRLRAARQGA